MVERQCPNPTLSCRVLTLQRTQMLGLSSLHTSTLPAPALHRLLGHMMEAAPLPDLVQRLGLGQTPNMLCFRKALTLHVPSSQEAVTLTYPLDAL